MKSSCTTAFKTLPVWFDVASDSTSAIFHACMSTRMATAVNRCSGAGNKSRGIRGSADGAGCGGGACPPCPGETAILQQPTRRPVLQWKGQLSDGTDTFLGPLPLNLTPVASLCLLASSFPHSLIHAYVYSSRSISSASANLQREFALGCGGDHHARL